MNIKENDCETNCVGRQNHQVCFCCSKKLNNSLRQALQ